LKLVHPAVKKTFSLLPQLLLLGVAPVLTGCYKHTRIVQQIRTPEVVMNASATELVDKLNTNFDALRTLNTSITLTASVGGGHAGKVTTYTSVKGYILMRKPRDIRVILQAPLLGSVLANMVSDGNSFKLVIPVSPYNKAIVGTEEIKTPSKKPLENLRPGIFFDAFLIQGVSPDDSVALTQSDRLLTTDLRKRQAIEEPDYDLAVLHKQAGNILQTARVLRYSRVTLLPFQQDIYDDKGRIVTTVLYDNYQKFGDLDFPMSIDIRRPYDEYELKIVVTKLTANKTLDNDQFNLQIPVGMTIQHMN
jgi:outer membrane lipoprotein-sorting protein